MAMLNKKLEIFKMAAAIQNFSETAEALGMTQPNVTQQIASLEKEFHVKLFKRSSRQITLTAAGEALRDECERLFLEVSEIERKIHNASQRVHHYKVGGTLTAGGYILPELAAKYMLRNIHDKLSIHVANTHEICDLLKKRVLDAALIEGPFDRNLFISEKIMEDELVPVAPKGTYPAEISLKQYLQGHGKFVLREPDSGTRYHFDRFLQKLNLPQPEENCLIETNSFDALKQLVIGGYGISVISRLAVQNETALNKLDILQFKEGSLTRSIDFIYLAGEHYQFAENFLAFCKRQVKEKL